MGGGTVMQVVSQPERSYTTAQISKRLGVSSETIRKYNSLFYAHNVRFSKIKGKLMYTQRDIELFQKLQQLHSTSGKSLSDCVAEVLGVTNSVTENSNVIQLVTEVTEVIKVTEADPQLPKQDMEVIKQHLQRLEQGQERLKHENDTLRSSIDKKVSNRDTALLEVIRSVQEIKRELATIKRKKWWQFWK